MRLLNMPSHKLLGPLVMAAVWAMTAVLAQAQDELVAVEAAHATMCINGGIG